ncbi:MAG: hypothetical protein JXR47_04275 [Thiotrichales bacterium]|nr:hypothetical protein [Thiotrichales bacterium]
MTPFNPPSLSTVIESLSKLDFWVGAFVFSVITYLVTSFYYEIQFKQDQFQHTQMVSKLDNEKAKYLSLSTRYLKLAKEYDDLSIKNSKQLDNMSGYCNSQRKLIQSLQKDYQLEARYTQNYEYLSILEKVMIKMFNNAQQCYEANKQK